ncbi:unnamed protein product, partial [marine sediment metagenome]
IMPIILPLFMIFSIVGPIGEDISSPTELIRITENTVGMFHGEEFLNSSACKPEHNLLNQKIIQILKKYQIDKESFNALEKHVLKHLQ